MRKLPLRLYCALLLPAAVACGTNPAAPGAPSADGGTSAPAPPGLDASASTGSFDMADGGASSQPECHTPTGPTGTPSGTPGSGQDAASTATPPPGAGLDASASPTDAANGLTVDSRAQYCAGSGPPVTVGDTLAGRDVCTGAIAEWTFSHALCTCKDAAIPGVFATDSFDSTLGPYQPGQAGAPVGVNHDLSLGGVPSIGGTLTVTGPDGLSLAGGAVVQGDLQVSANLAFAGVGTVARDLWTGGGLEAAGVVTVGRDLHDPSWALAAGIVAVGGSTITSPFTLAPPCACAPGQILDVDGIVAQGERQNDNASIGLDPDALDAVAGVVNIELPCGRFYLTQIAGAGVIHVGVQGRTALFVGGDIATAGVLDVNIAPAGELDVFVAGNFVPTGVSSFGNASRPAAVRIYVGGSKDVLLTGVNAFVGNVYAPNANVALTGVSDVYGSIFAGNFTAPGVTTIHFDRGVLDAGNECPPDAPDAGSTPTPDAAVPDAGVPGIPDSGSPTGPTSTPDASPPNTPPVGPVDAGQPPPPPPPPPPACQTCGSCSAGTACVGSTCGACGTDSDCCAPLVCNGGRCGEYFPR